MNEQTLIPSSYSAMPCSAVPCDETPYNAVQCDAI